MWWPLRIELKINVYRVPHHNNEHVFFVSLIDKENAFNNKTFKTFFILWIRLPQRHLKPFFILWNRLPRGPWVVVYLHRLEFQVLSFALI